MVAIGSLTRYPSFEPLPQERLKEAETQYLSFESLPQEQLKKTETQDPSFEPPPQERLKETELKQLILALEERWPGLKSDWQAQVTFVNQDRAELMYRGVRIEIQGLDQLAKKIEELQQRELQLEDKKEANLERIAQVNHVGSALSVASMGFRFGAGAGLVSAGAVVPGGALIGSAFLSAVHQIAEKLEWYKSGAASLGGDDKAIAQRAYVLQRGVAFIDLGLSIATAFVGGTDGLSAGWAAITGTTVDAKGITNLSSAARGLMTVVQGHLQGEKGHLEVDYLGVRLQINIHGQTRDQNQEGVDAGMEHLQKLFDSELHTIRILQQIDKALWHNVPER